MLSGINRALLLLLALVPFFPHLLILSFVDAMSQSLVPYADINKLAQRGGSIRPQLDQCRLIADPQERYQALLEIGEALLKISAEGERLVGEFMEYMETDQNAYRFQGQHKETWGELSKVRRRYQDNKKKLQSAAGSVLLSWPSSGDENVLAGQTYHTVRQIKKASDNLTYEEAKARLRRVIYNRLMNRTRGTSSSLHFLASDWERVADKSMELPDLTESELDNPTYPLRVTSTGFLAHRALRPEVQAQSQRPTFPQRTGYAETIIESPAMSRRGTTAQPPDRQASAPPEVRSWSRMTVQPGTPVPSRATPLSRQQSQDEPIDPVFMDESSWRRTATPGAGPRGQTPSGAAGGLFGNLEEILGPQRLQPPPPEPPQPESMEGVRFEQHRRERSVESRMSGLSIGTTRRGMVQSTSMQSERSLREATPNPSVTGAGLNYSLGQGRYALRSTAAKMRGRKSRPTGRDEHGEEFEVLPGEVRVVPGDAGGVSTDCSCLNVPSGLKQQLNSTARLTQAESLHLLVQLDVEHLEHQAYLCAPHERKLAMKLGLVVEGLSADIIRRRILEVLRNRHRLFDMKVSPQSHYFAAEARPPQAGDYLGVYRIQPLGEDRFVFDYEGIARQIGGAMPGARLALENRGIARAVGIMDYLKEDEELWAGMMEEIQMYRWHERRSGQGGTG